MAQDDKFKKLKKAFYHFLKAHTQSQSDTHNTHSLSLASSHTHRHTHRHTETHTDTQTYTHRDTQTHTQTHRHTTHYTHRHTHETNVSCNELIS